MLGPSSARPLRGAGKAEVTGCCSSDRAASIGVCWRPIWLVAARSQPEIFECWSYPPIDRVARSDAVCSANNNDHLMLWFRKQLRLGSWLALVAPAIKFRIALGHVQASRKSGFETHVSRMPATATARTRQSPRD